jgi:GNAT superfamily N-acetyltransferase
MSLVRIRPGDADQVATLTAIYRAARPVDDPDAMPVLAAEVADDLAYGFDLEPAEKFFYLPPGSDVPVGVLEVDMPVRDNRHLTWTAITVDPAHRRRGHGTAIMAEAVERTKNAGRNTIWAGIADDDSGAQSFMTSCGFRFASRDARRRQRLADVDQASVDRLHAEAVGAANGYTIERLRPPLTDAALAELVEVTKAINDAPTGELTVEAENFDVERLRNNQTANHSRGASIYRVVARNCATGEVGGHTIMFTNPRRPTFAQQGDTAVSRAHRGHRLGLLLKLEMMHWLAEVEPQLEVVETWNNDDNQFMIAINEALGYRLNRLFATYQLTL